MGFFNDLGKKASEAYNVTKEKTTKLSGELKLKGKISDCKNKIEDIQLEIGKMVYAEFQSGTKGQNAEEVKAKCEEIVNLENDIKKAEEDILALKDIKKCVSCGAEISLNTEFCSKCGTKQPEVEKAEEVVEEAEQEVKEEKEEEKTEENSDKE